MNIELVQHIIRYYVFIQIQTVLMAEIKYHVNNLYQPLTLILLGRDNKMIE